MDRCMMYRLDSIDNRTEQNLCNTACIQQGNLHLFDERTSVTIPILYQMFILHDRVYEKLKEMSVKHVWLVTVWCSTTWKVKIVCNSKKEWFLTIYYSTWMSGNEGAHSCKPYILPPIQTNL